MARCEVCDKSIIYGNKLSITRSHISKRTSRTWKPNLRTVKTNINGEPRKIKVCAKCLRSGKVQKV
jgi:large subunit ribosomal protein L28